MTLECCDNDLLGGARCNNCPNSTQYTSTKKEELKEVLEENDTQNNGGRDNRDSL